MSCHAWMSPTLCQAARIESCATASESSKVAIIAPRDKHRSKTRQLPIGMFSKKYSNDVSVPMFRQRLNRFRRMLITRSDDGYFGQRALLDRSGQAVAQEERQAKISVPSG